VGTECLQKHRRTLDFIKRVGSLEEEEVIPPSFAEIREPLLEYNTYFPSFFEFMTNEVWAMDTFENVVQSYTALIHVLKKDIEPLFNSTRDLACDAIDSIKFLIFEDRIPRYSAMDSKNQCCIQFFLRYMTARKEMDKLEYICDHILAFTQLCDM
jgi:hypothetical protein